MVGDDHDEAVDVRDDVGQGQVRQRVEVERGAEEEQGGREEEEAQEEVRADDLLEELPAGEDALGLPRHNLGDRDGRQGVEAGRQRDLVLAHLGDLHLLVGVRGVVRPLPEEHGEEGHGVPLGALPGRGVALEEVRVRVLTEAVVMQVVVLDAPGLREHPVEPVHRALEEAPDGEAAAAVLAGRVRAVVAAVADVVPDHRPGAVRPQAQGKDGDGVGRHPHGGDTDDPADPAPPDHLDQVLLVILALLGLQLLAERVDLLAPG
mmetsp:Transcript_13701/g.36272  ORF Transcript_13701/g.36272 Transcript_13701/m.36272 type:complete len:263 (+) Transcript_13701:977-1765(+)